MPSGMHNAPLYLQPSRCMCARACVRAGGGGGGWGVGYEAQSPRRHIGEFTTTVPAILAILQHLQTTFNSDDKNHYPSSTMARGLIGAESGLPSTTLPSQFPTQMPSPPPSTFKPSTLSPTLPPSPLPSASPTLTPSRGPSPTPSLLPSSLPTRQPSSSPTPTPSPPPTSLPTRRWPANHTVPSTG